MDNDFDIACRNINKNQENFNKILENLKKKIEKCSAGSKTQFIRIKGWPNYWSKEPLGRTSERIKFRQKSNQFVNFYKTVIA